MAVSHNIIAWLLAALSAIGPFAIDSYLPAFQEIEHSLSASRLEVQQTLSFFMFSFAIMALWQGALADQFGRRRVVIILTGLFAVASLLCALAPTIHWLWLGRILQGIAGGVGLTIGRVIVRDLYDGVQAQRLMARIMIIFAIAPAIAPVIGGVLLHLAGWRAIFLFMAVFAAVLTWTLWRYLPETLQPEQRQPLRPLALLRAYRQIMSHGDFLLLGFCLAVAFNGFFIYIVSAPVFINQHLGLNANNFAWLFVPIVLGFMLGSLLAGKLAGRSSAENTLRLGFVIMVVAVLWNTLYAALLPARVPWSVLPVMLYCLGLAVLTPSLTLKVLDVFPQQRGMASSCQSFMQIGLNAVTAAVIAPLLWTSPLSLALGSGLFLLLAIVLLYYQQKRRNSPEG